MVKQLTALILIIISFIFIYLIIFIYYNKTDNVSTPGEDCMWHPSLRPDQAFQHNVICKQNAEEHHQAGHQ
jgi:hypothetical protein